MSGGRGKVLFVLDSELKVVHQIALDSHILAVTSAKDQLLVSTLEAPYVSGFSLSSSFAPYADESIVSQLRQSLSTAGRCPNSQFPSECMNGVNGQGGMDL